MRLLMCARTSITCWLSEICLFFVLRWKLITYMYTDLGDFTVSRSTGYHLKAKSVPCIVRYSLMILIQYGLV